MLMTIDVGNTNIAVGIYQEDEIVASFRLITRIARTSDEIAADFYSVMNAKGLNPKEIDNVVLSSVVPNLNHAISSAVIKYFNVEPMIISLDLKTGIKCPIRDLGADRLVDAVAAHQFYGPEVLVIDFGTATTYDFIDKEGNFVSGITAPGIQIEADALTNMTSQLPKIALVKPDSVLTVDTITSMQIGVVYGYIGSVEYIIQSLKKELGRDFKVVATGGFGSLICPHTKMIDVYDPDLAYKGMKYIYELNK